MIYLRSIREQERRKKNLHGTARNSMHKLCAFDELNEIIVVVAVAAAAVNRIKNLVKEFYFKNNGQKNLKTCECERK
jgi:hypothetical protein